MFVNSGVNDLIIEVKCGYALSVVVLVYGQRCGRESAHMADEAESKGLGP